jgi:hypothetical protein
VQPSTRGRPVCKLAEVQTAQLADGVRSGPSPKEDQLLRLLGVTVSNFDDSTPPGSSN